MSQSSHHHHLRKRVFKNLEPFPHPNKLKRWMDHFMYIAGFAGPMFTIPQVIEVYSKQNADGLSSVSWIAYTFFSLSWLFYGILHKERVIIFSNSLWLIFNAMIAIGTLIY